MSSINVGDVVVSADNGLLSFSTPQRDEPVGVKYADLPLLLDLLDNLGWDRRSAFRVPVNFSSDLTVSVECGDKTYQVQPIDISMTGILVEFSEAIAPDLSTGDSVDLTLQFADIETSLSGTVCRRDRSRYGFIFPTSFQGDQVEPPPHLQRIVHQLETQWIKRRLYG